MIFRPLVRSLPFAFVWVAAVACGASDGARPTTQPGLVSTATDASADSADPDAGTYTGAPAPADDGLKRTKLRDDDGQFTNYLVGITTGATPHVVYTRETNNSTGPRYDYLEAVPITGGFPVRLAAYLPYRVDVSGGAVAWYDGTNGEGYVANAIHFWTTDGGTKTVITPTRPGLFAASQDGSLIAFSTNATLAASDVSVTTSAAPSAADPALAGGNAVANKATCRSYIAFAGTTLVAGYCTLIPIVEDDVNTTQRPKLVTVSAGAAVVRIDNALPADAFETRWYADTSGSKLFVLGPKPDLRGRVIITDGPSTTVAVVDANIKGVDVAKDGSAVVYVSNGALKRATFAAEPEVTAIVPGAVLELLAMSVDSKRALFSTIGDSPSGLSDLNTVDVTATLPAIVPIVATPTARVIGFNGSGTNVLYMDEPFVASNGTTLRRLKSKPASGGPEKVLDAAAFAAYAAPAGNGVLSVSSAKPQVFGCGDTTLRHANSVTGFPSRSVATAVFTCPADTAPPGFWSARSFAYHDEGSLPGVYAITLE